MARNSRRNIGEKVNELEIQIALAQMQGDTKQAQDLLDRLTRLLAQTNWVAVAA